MNQDIDPTKIAILSEDYDYHPSTDQLDRTVAFINRMIAICNTHQIRMPDFEFYQGNDTVVHIEFNFQEDGKELIIGFPLDASTKAGLYGTVKNKKDIKLDFFLPEVPETLAQWIVDHFSESTSK